MTASTRNLTAAAVVAGLILGACASDGIQNGDKADLPPTTVAVTSAPDDIEPAVAVTSAPVDVEPTASPAVTDRLVVESASYGQEFELSSCDNFGESSFAGVGTVNGLQLDVNATSGRGTIAIDGGTEQDGVTLNGTIAQVEKGDADDFFIAGTWTEPNFAGETFTATGFCTSYGHAPIQGSSGQVDGPTETFTGTVTGPDRVQHTIEARQGEAIRLELASDSTFLFFTLFGPDPDAQALFAGMTELEPNTFETVIEQTGTYRILVFQVGDAEDSGATASYSLRLTRQ